jgi:hypothetical protein
MGPLNPALQAGLSHRRLSALGCWALNLKNAWLGGKSFQNHGKHWSCADEALTKSRKFSVEA